MNIADAGNAQHALAAASLGKVHQSSQASAQGALRLIEAAGEVPKATQSNDGSRGQNFEAFA